MAELLDTGLLGENFIPVLREAANRGWLAPRCRVLPARARVYAQLVESACLRRMATLDASALGFALPWVEQWHVFSTAQGCCTRIFFEGEGLRSFSTGPAQALPAEYGASGSASPYDCPLASLLARGAARTLSTPFQVWEIDFQALPPASRARPLRVHSTAAGRLDAVVFWWECVLRLGGVRSLRYREGHRGSGRLYRPPSPPQNATFAALGRAVAA